MKKLSLSAVLNNPKHFKKITLSDRELKTEMHNLELMMMRAQQGVFHKKDRVVIALEGFDAAGKGGTIRKLTEFMDPRSVRVVPIGAPNSIEQGTHWLYRFWKELPPPGSITIFDRSWYGRVLVEKVEKLTSPDKLARAYDEIKEFEAQLTNDGIKVIKLFLAITKDEQLSRFEARLKDPYKQWKITMDDVRARKQWPQYVKAVDEMLLKTNTQNCPWYMIPANSKALTRREALKIVTSRLSEYPKWLEKNSQVKNQKKLAALLKEA